MHRVPLADERARPVVEHLRGRHVISDAEGEVQVGEPVAAVHGQRAHGGAGDDALILLRKLQYVLAERIPLLNGEHAARSYLCSVETCSSRPGSRTSGRSK